MRLEFQERAEQAALVVKAYGELDLYSAGEFATKVLGRIVGGFEVVVLDFGELNYLDSSGTGAIIRVTQHCRTKKARACIASLKPSPKRVLTMINILSLIKDYDSVEKAIAAQGRLRCSSAAS